MIASTTNPTPHHTISVAAPAPPRWQMHLGRALVVVLFGLPLFLGLGRWDMRNDEAIYTYAVDRILATGEWLTPQSIPGEGPFLEKPPLKFWLVAGAMRLGLLPQNEFGMRAVDALFGVVLLLYVFALGARAAGPLCGFIAAFITYTFEPLLFEHGLRSNNMEGALVLAHAAAAYHFERWLHHPHPARRRAHAIGVALAFVLGFMTKFVAIAFLPIAFGIALLWRPGSLAELRTRWTEWRLPAALVVVLVAPWFVYQSYLFGRYFWEVIFGVHVFQRFTAHLDPTHLHAWHYYFSQTWSDFGYSGTRALVVAGLVPLLAHAWTGRPWLARLCLAWWLVPLALMSLMTSKLFHYAYPFLPPLAIGTGWAAVWVVRLVARQIAPRFAKWAASTRYVRHVVDRPRLAAGLTGLAAVAMLMAVWTWVQGEPVVFSIGDVRLFRNSSVLRPLVIAGICLVLVGHAGVAARGAAAAMLIALVPVDAYHARIRRSLEFDRPLHAISACMKSQVRAGVAARSGLYVANPSEVAHPYSYYLRQTGPWDEGADRLVDEARVRLFEPGAQTPIVLSRAQYVELRRQMDLGRIVGFETEPNVAMLLPGPYTVCLSRPIEVGGRLVDWDGSAGR